jgi:hypothetical protein|tara:strand:- start:194 stop:505 length:312 start_codon:yes stop_codon:yes gene_type:complete
MITIYNKNIFDNKEQLTAPKTSDRFVLDINLNNGQRFYKVLIGRKWIYFRPVHNQGVIKKSVVEGKRILYNKYWKDAQTDAHYEYCVGDNKRKSLPKNWKEAY